MNMIKKYNCQYLNQTFRYLSILFFLLTGPERMGIPRLTKFIKENYQWKSVRVQPGSKIVIDGYSLCYPLYYQHHAWQLGGDYREFYETVSNYFQRLKQLKIEPYIVIDGVDYDNVKLATNRRRFEQRLANIESRKESVLPLFAKSVFVDVLRDFGLNFYVANGEADQDVVSLANYLGCHVLGKDSDFFVFNIEQGYIPICDLDSGSVVDLGGKVKCFLYYDFDVQFSLCDPDLRLYLPVFLGNDFQEGYSSSRLGIGSNMLMNEIVYKIGGIEEENKCDGQALRIKKKVHLFYRIPSRSYEFLAKSTFLCTRNRATPQWALDLYKRGKFVHELMNLLSSPPPKTWEYSVVIEDIKKKPVHGRSQKQ